MLLATVNFLQMIAAWKLSITTLLLIPPIQLITMRAVVYLDWGDAEDQRKYLKYVRCEETCLSNFNIQRLPFTRALTKTKSGRKVEFWLVLIGFRTTGPCNLV